MKHSLEVFFNDELIFSSDGKWLHPLFELEEFLRQQNYPIGSLTIKDKIVGRAAALLQVKLGLKTVKAVMMSEFGKQVFDHFNIDYEYKNLVPRIECRTEEMLKNEIDPEVAYFILKNLTTNKLTN
jgi:hypothetical protein